MENSTSANEASDSGAGQSRETLVSNLGALIRQHLRRSRPPCFGVSAIGQVRQIGNHKRPGQKMNGDSSGNDFESPAVRLRNGVHVDRWSTKPDSPAEDLKRRGREAQPPIAAFHSGENRTPPTLAPLCGHDAPTEETPSVIGHHPGLPCCRSTLVLAGRPVVEQSAAHLPFAVAAGDGGMFRPRPNRVMKIAVMVEAAVAAARR
jgi:hypothetical protein